MEQESKKSFLINVTFVVVTLGLVWLASKFMLGYLLPFVIGGVSAFLVQRPAKAISSRFPLKTGTWAAILVAGIFVAVIAVAVMVFWNVGARVLELVSHLPDQAEGIAKVFDQLNDRLSVMLQSLPPAAYNTISSAVDKSFDTFVSSVTSLFSKLAASFAGNIPSYFFSAVITVVAGCYIAKDFERLCRFIKGMLKPQSIKTLKIIKEILTESILKFVWGYLILSFITFIELIIGYFVLQVKYPVIIAGVTALIDILPVFGSGTVLIPWAAFCFLTGNFTRGIGLLILYIIILVVRYFAEPRVIGGSIGVNPLLTLITMFLGLRLGGFGGMLLFPVICIVIINYYKYQLDEERQLHK